MPYNRILTDTDRQECRYATTIDIFSKYLPEMTSQKIAAALIQQSFVHRTALELLPKHAKILSAGSYMDVAAELLRLEGWSVYDVDPAINCDLHTFKLRVPYQFNGVIATSVLEHTADDEEFITDICQLLVPYGYAILTCDFKNDWSVGQPVPYTSNRFYTEHDLIQRLNTVLNRQGCTLVDTPDYSARDTFIWDGINYSFATYVFKKDR